MLRTESNKQSDPGVNLANLGTFRKKVHYLIKHALVGEQTASGRGLAGQPGLNAVKKKINCLIQSKDELFSSCSVTAATLSEILSTRTLNSSAFPCKPKTGPCRWLLLILINPTSDEAPMGSSLAVPDLFAPSVVY